MADLLLTGLPRSGSASIGALIDTLADAVCLNTPPWQAAFARNPVDILPFSKWLVGDFAWARRQLLEGVAVGDIRAEDGTPLMDGMKDARGVREANGDLKAVPFIRHDLTENFTLAMRQTTLFTSALPVIASLKHFMIVAVVRHPLDVCMAWHELAQPILAAGNPPGIARFWPEALAVLQGGSMAEQFAGLYELHMQRYHELGATVLRYEDVMAEPMLVSRLLGREMLPSAAARLVTPAQQSINEKTETLRAVFHKTGVYSKLYYPDL